MGKKKKAKNEISKKVDATRGSDLWVFNYDRGRLLTCLLNDLSRLKLVGLDEDNCSKVTFFLECFENSATAISSGGMFAGPIYKDIKAFREVYVDWNKIEGSKERNIEERQIIHDDLKAKRQKISDKCRKIQYLIEKDLDVKILKSGIEAISDLVKAVPDLVIELAKTMKEFRKKMKGR